MPEISRFLGIIIAMYYNDHAPPHFHAKYSGSEIKVDIVTGEVIDGQFPPRARPAQGRIAGGLGVSETASAT